MRRVEASNISDNTKKKEEKRIEKRKRKSMGNVERIQIF